MKKIMNISSEKDLEELLLAIIQDKEVEIGEVKPIPFTLKFKGENFKVKNGYISADFADLLVTFKKDYREFLVTTLGKSKARDTDIQFKIEDGSIELGFLNDLPKEIWEQINKMSGRQISITIIIAILGYFASSSWKDSLDHREKVLEKQLQADTNKEALSIAKESIQLLKENKKLELRKNRPMKQAIEMLSEEDELEIKNDSQSLDTYSKDDSSKFIYDEDENDIPSTYTDTFIIKGFTKEAYGWNIKIQSTNKEAKPRSFWATSKLLPENNIKLFQHADDGTTLKLKVAVVKNKGKIKEAYISDIAN